MVSFVAAAFLLAHGLLAVTSESQSIQQSPSTTLRLNPESGLPVAGETKLETILIFDPETELSLSQSGTQPQRPDTAGALGADESTYIQQVAGGRLYQLKRIGGQPFPIRVIGGLAIFGGLDNASNLAISHGFSKGIKINGYRDLYESFYLYPELTLGVLAVNRENQLPELKNEYSIYGMIEGHRRWVMKNMRAALFLGVGVGGYDVGREEFAEGGGSYGFITERGVGLIASAGAQLSTRTLMAGLYLYRSPGLGEIVTIANVGYQPLTYKTAFVLGAGALSVLVIFGLLAPGN